MYHKIRQVHGLNATRDQVYAAMTDADPERLENRKPILKEKKAKSTFSSVSPNWVLSMDGHDKLMGYQNSTFPLAVYGCMDTTSENYCLFGLGRLTVTQFILRVGIFSTFINPKRCRLI